MQALVEFECAEIAKKVKHAINGADIYSGCCTLKVEFAKPDHVKVTRQDNDQFDFTLPYGTYLPRTCDYVWGLISLYLLSDLHLDKANSLVIEGYNRLSRTVSCLV
ncbi:unnamed protein product [Cylicocyclus nassatus]|uniref:Uncharacterized protein n=1 Tax=Cylicocyclus nassatus TaxID=53992 RepID=A0AA36HGD7_CYLNA|nr:unnamed protein product [Cylicocyclus nassatus]